MAYEEKNGVFTMTHYKTETLDLRLMDCMELMRETPDKFYDLAVVDPPYGIGAHKEQGLGDKRNGNRKESKWKGGAWDESIPDESYFTELFRTSKNQIIFGGNYYDLPPTRCFLIWDKVHRIDNADAELAWTSFAKSTRIFQFAGQNLMGFMNPNRFHPTEKPVALYRWIFANYAKPGMRILDTHLGSASSAIAAHYSGVHLTGCELDPDYFAASIKRVIDNTAQLTFDL